jgi:hypothetical protein
MTTRTIITAIVLLALPALSVAVETVTRAKNLSVDTAADARLLIDLAGSLWVVPSGGGKATRIGGEDELVQRPRWSPDGQQIVYAGASGGKRGIRIYSLASGETRRAGSDRWLDLHPDWHPGGERIIFSSDRRGTGFDLWELDVPTGLEWRLSNRSGDEIDPAWSADGRDLVYVHHDGADWSLILREHGQPEEVLVTGPGRLAGPSWRPDSSLIMFWREDDAGWALHMVILAQPRLVRHYMSGEDYVPAPVSWLDKHRMFYAAGGRIRQRLFNAWSSRTVPFRATITTEPEVRVERVRRTLPRIDEPDGSLVIRAGRLFDGVTGTYLRDRDILIEGGRIQAVEPRAERPGRIVVDMGDLTVVPGLVDALARLPDGTDAATGPLLLASGVTTIIADHPQAEHLNAVWSGDALPGPRLLPVDDWPAGNVSELADSQTPGMGPLLESRAAQLVGFREPVARRFAEVPTLEHGVTDVVLGSRANGMPAGIGTQAELRALQAAGLDPAQALRAAGVNAAAVLGVDPRLGRIATGSVADLLLVDGDPLERIADALNVIGVVRNGRFYSVAGLVDRAARAQAVE